MKSPLLADCHIHAIAFDSEATRNYGNITSAGGMRKYSHSYIARYHGLNLKSPDFNELYFTNLDSQVKHSRAVKKGIVFGLDGIYDARGKLDRQRTCFMITNDYVYDMVKKKKNLRFAASINPLRKDALAELEKSIERKTALVKLLPNAQDFSPDNPKLKKFYRAIAAKKIPLLVHTGYEFALKSTNQSYGQPEKFRMALDEGVTLIAAHGGATGLVFVELFKKTLLDLVRRYPDFYLDISALSIATRTGIIPFLRSCPELKPRLLFGTDYPLPIHFYPFIFSLGLKKIAEIRKIGNYFDQYAAIMNELGLLPQKQYLKF